MNKLSALGFSRNHALLLGLGVVVFAILVYQKTDLSVSAMFATSAETGELLSYDQVRSELANTESGSSNIDVAKEMENKIALLDRQLEDGKVLGDSIGLGDIPSASEIFTPENLDSIKLNISNNNSIENLKRYQSQLTIIEADHDVISMLAKINSDNPSEISQSKTQAEEMIKSMVQISIPSNLVEFHRYKILYLSTLTNLAEIWLGDRAESDLKVQTSILFSVLNKIESLRSEINIKYQMTL